LWVFSEIPCLALSTVHLLSSVVLSLFGHWGRLHPRWRWLRSSPGTNQASAPVLCKSLKSPYMVQSTEGNYTTLLLGLDT
jgi:hypothetical protein